MTPENFAYWLQGFFEIHGAGESIKESLDINQVRMIKEHLALVHRKVTPNINGPATLGGVNKNPPPHTSKPSLTEMLEEMNKKSANDGIDIGLYPNRNNFGPGLGIDTTIYC